MNIINTHNNKNTSISDISNISISNIGIRGAAEETFTTEENMTYNVISDEDARSIASMPSLHEQRELYQDLNDFNGFCNFDPDGDNDDDEEEDTYEELTDEGTNRTTTKRAGSKRSLFSRKNSTDISMDLNDLLQEMEEERDTSHSDCGGSVCGSTGSLSLNLDHEESPQRIGSKLKLDDLPSQNSRDWGWGSFGSLMGSFSKLGGGGSSRRLGGSRRLGSSRRLLRRNKKSERSGGGEKPAMPDRRKKKTVRFKKFETVFPSMESFRRLHQDDCETKNQQN